MGDGGQGEARIMERPQTCPHENLSNPVLLF